MLTPPRALPENAHIAVLAASGPSELGRIRDAAKAIEARGHRVTIAENVDHRFRGYLAGDDDERAETLNRFLRSDEFDAYFFARGGYGAMRILDRIDYDAVLRNPRPIVGFSDITALHQAIAIHAGVATFHGPMLNLDFHAGLSADREEWLWSILSGAAPMTHRFTSKQIVAEGSADGVLFGGCLALTDALVGTAYDYWIDDGIWFWEDVEEPPYRLDRMLTHLRLTGRLRRIRGVIVGSLKECGESSEIDALLRDVFGGLDIPVVRDLPFGHDGNNLLMPIGAAVRLDTHDGSLTITEPAVVR
jgi:muramoyltetrapeptide carboxypeptidase